MKRGSAIGLLLVIMTLFFSCQKEKVRCAAAISIRLNGRVEEIEWIEVEGKRADRTGGIIIEATGHNDERFLLKLQDVYDTGTIANLTITQLFIADGLGFSAKGIQSGFINIKERSAMRLSGSFNVMFESSDGAANAVRAEGVFAIYGNK